MSKSFFILDQISFGYDEKSVKQYRVLFENDSDINFPNLNWKNLNSQPASVVQDVAQLRYEKHPDLS